jgi:anaerobic magnesium-protoporphyrin IX monomethyl ester cyclase
MQRGVRVEQVREAVALCRAHGIQVGMFLMWGYEGEEPVDIEATVAHVKACMPDVFLTTVSYPIKGTPYYERVESKLVGIGGWAESTDRDFKIAGRHSRRYYGFADQLLKSEVAFTRSRDPRLESEIDAARRGLAEAYQEVEA